MKNPTNEEILALVRRLSTDRDAIMTMVRGEQYLCTEWATWPAEARDSTRALAIHEYFRLADRRRARGAPQRRAMRLLRSLLTPEQRRALQRRGEFYVTGSAGGRYRLFPRRGLVWRVERHGRRDYVRASYCIHDEDQELPWADVTVAHLLLLQTDEPEFLAIANERIYNQMWNGDYLRRMNHARRRREEGDTLCPTSASAPSTICMPPTATPALTILR